MTELNQEKIRETQRREKKDMALAALEADFYQSLAASMGKAGRDQQENPSPEALREMENSSKLARDLFETREQKIVMKALRQVRGGTGKEEHLTQEEKKLFEALISSLETHRAFFEKTLKGIYETQVETPKTLLNRDEHKIVLVRVLKEVPRFIGSDAREHGPFKQNSLVKLPGREAELLLKRNLVEKM
jgi:DNA replication initiation complex subunit (GINS family)